MPTFRMGVMVGYSVGLWPASLGCVLINPDGDTTRWKGEAMFARFVTALGCGKFFGRQRRVGWPKDRRLAGSPRLLRRPTPVFEPLEDRCLLSLAPLGEEFRVNTPTGGDQVAPSVD